MKRITLQIGLTMALLVLVGSVYSQTAVPNLVRLVSLAPASGGTTSTSSIISEDDSTITIDAAGAVTVGSDYTPTSATGNTTAAPSSLIPTNGAGQHTWEAGFLDNVALTGTQATNLCKNAQARIGASNVGAVC